MNNFILPSAWMGRRVNVLLLGCGGTGSEMVDELFRIHSLLVELGGEGLHVVAFDDDTVSRPNIGRQRFWECDIGLNKADILVNRVNNFGGASWVSKPVMFDCHNHNHLSILSQSDIVITCVDNVSLRTDLGNLNQNINADGLDHIYWLDCGNDDSSGNVIFGKLIASSGEYDGRSLPNVFDLYPVLAEMKDINQPSCSTQIALSRQDYGINRSVAREGANIIWQLLRHGKIEHHGSFINIKDGSVSPLRIDPEVWNSFS